MSDDAVDATGLVERLRDDAEYNGGVPPDFPMADDLRDTAAIELEAIAAITRLQAEVADLRHDIERALAANSSLLAQVAAKDEEIARLTKDVRVLEDEVSKYIGKTMEQRERAESAEQARNVLRQLVEKNMAQIERLARKYADVDEAAEAMRAALRTVVLGQQPMDYGKPLNTIKRLSDVAFAAIDAARKEQG